jgi:oxygen-independent coproporphyrinogen-3 oxidase
MAGVYLSFPFCSQKCTYCNFASGVLPAALEPRYLEALRCEIEQHLFDFRPETVYLGGGTPSRIASGDLARLLEAIPGREWREATIEAAPGAITAEAARGWVEAGITRVSLGVQSFDARELRQTGRRHDAGTVFGEVAVLRNAGLDNINIDLIAGLAHQTRASWNHSLEQALRLEVPHVSVYILEVDEDSRLGLEVLNNGGRYGAANLPSEEEAAGNYELAVERLASVGIERYEISNFARPGSESLHNLKYWRLEPYCGFGSDAHGFDGTTRRRNTDDVAGYIERIERGEPACVEEIPADARERLWVGLRLSEGVAMGQAEFESLGMRRFAEAGLIDYAGGVARLTGRGVLLSNEVFQALV